MNARSRVAGYRLGPPADDPRVDDAIAPAPGLVVALLFCAVLHSLRWSLAADEVVLIVLLAAAAWWVRPLGALAVAVIAFCCLQGFDVGRAGQLAWHGWPDAARLLLLVAVASSVACLRGRSLDRRRLDVARRQLVGD
jgi:hypothetical protein